MKPQHDSGTADEIGLTEIASLLNCSRNSAYLYVRAGDIEGGRLVAGKLWVAPRVAVERFREQRLEAKLVRATKNATAYFAGDKSKATSKRLPARGQLASADQIASGEKYWHGGLTDAAKADYPEGMSPADIEFMRHGRQDVEVLPQHDLDSRNTLGHSRRPLERTDTDRLKFLVDTGAWVYVSHGTAEDPTGYTVSEQSSGGWGWADIASGWPAEDAIDAAMDIRGR